MAAGIKFDKRSTSGSSGEERRSIHSSTRLYRECRPVRSRCNSGERVRRWNRHRCNIAGHGSIHLLFDRLIWFKLKTIKSFHNYQFHRFHLHREQRPRPGQRPEQRSRKNQVSSSVTRQWTGSEWMVAMIQFMNTWIPWNTCQWYN